MFSQSEPIKSLTNGKCRLNLAATNSKANTYYT